MKLRNNLKKGSVIFLLVICFLFLSFSSVEAQQCQTGGGCNCPGGCGQAVYPPDRQEYCPCGDWSCCGGGGGGSSNNFSCLNNNCRDVGNGDYSSNSCNGNCGIRCTLTPLGSSNSASRTSNTRSCDIGLGVGNPNNPSSYRIECSAEGNTEGYTRNWQFSEISSDNVGKRECNFSSNSTPTCPGVFRDGGNITMTSNTSTNGNKSIFSADVSITWPEGIEYSFNPISFIVTDKPERCTVENSNCKLLNTVQIVDTKGPTLSRNFEIESASSFIVEYKATDARDIKSHSYFCGPGAFSEATGGTYTPGTYPYVSEYRQDESTVMTGYPGSNFVTNYQTDPSSTLFSCPNVNSTTDSFNALGNNSANFYQKRTFSESGTAEGKTLKVTGNTDSRRIKYSLKDVFSGQAKPVEIGFGNGKDGSEFGKWYAEDAWCNVSSDQLPKGVTVGNPWLQTKNGNTYIKGKTNKSSLNYTINRITPTCTSYFSSQSGKQSCPERNDDFGSTYLFSSNEFSTGPLPNSLYASKNGMKATDYERENLSSMYDKVTKMVTDSMEKTSSPLLADTSCIGDTNDGNLRVYNILSTVSYNNSNGNLLSLLRSSSVSDSTRSRCTTGMQAYFIKGDLNLDGSFTVNNPGIVLVSGNININADIKKLGGAGVNSRGLILVSHGNINILPSSYKSLNNKKVEANEFEYPLYDTIEAFLISDGRISTAKDTGTNLVNDGLKIFGGVVQTGTSISDDNYDPIFNRDLVLLQNLIAPSEQIVFDPSIEDIFSSVLYSKGILFSIRESK